MSDHKQRTKVYSLTAAGKKQLVKERSHWEQLSAAIAGILNRPEEGKA
jgi:DNA-binding PadR family transcriptional regulator